MARSTEEIKAELDNLKRIVGKRRGKPGYGANVREIDARIAEVEAELDE